MPTQSTHPIKSLHLDLKNLRILPQTDEEGALRGLVGINQDHFWGLSQSLLDDGYHPTDNILLVKDGKAGKSLLVKEGNRRVAAIKLILGLLKGPDLDVPSDIKEGIRNLPYETKKQLQEVPCLVYEPAESDLLDRAITRIHGKADKAGRSKWPPVAKARHNKLISPLGEPALDLLEAYLQAGKNLTQHQKEHWAGDFPLTVLNEAIQKLAPRLSLKSSREVADSYPSSTYRANFENLVHAIGEETLSFAGIRSASLNHLTTRFGFPDVPNVSASGNSPASSNGSSAKSGTTGGTGSPGQGSTGSRGGSIPTAVTGAFQKATTNSRKSAAAAHDDPVSVIKKLKDFKPKGVNRDKVASLAKEAASLSLGPGGQPHAFCFLLRSMFEISAKAYCEDHATDPVGPKAVKTDKTERHLVDVLRDVVTHLTKQSTDKAMEKRLHGAITDLASSASILSVTSMNQLVHNPDFSVDGSHISTVFNNIFPLLVELNS